MNTRIDINTLRPLWLDEVFIESNELSAELVTRDYKVGVLCLSGLVLVFCHRSLHNLGCLFIADQ
jgi:hypothetical protein